MTRNRIQTSRLSCFMTRTRIAQSNLSAKTKKKLHPTLAQLRNVLAGGHNNVSNDCTCLLDPRYRDKTAVAPRIYLSGQVGPKLTRPHLDRGGPVAQTRTDNGVTPEAARGCRRFSTGLGLTRCHQPAAVLEGVGALGPRPSFWSSRTLGIRVCSPQHAWASCCYPVDTLWHHAATIYSNCRVCSYLFQLPRRSATRSVARARVRTKDVGISVIRLYRTVQLFVNLTGQNWGYQPVQPGCRA